MAMELMQPLLVYADDRLVVVDKPEGMLSVPGRGPGKADCASARVQASYPDALVVHRLDMATSGLFLLARGPDMQRRMSHAFAGREVRKHYVAVVAGLIANDQGEIDLPLLADWPNRPRQVVDRAAGKPSRTLWRVMERDAQGGTTRVELQPVTGRSHQLRVHMQAIGHPILGDPLYAPPQVIELAPRLLLHAAALAFTHPATGDPVALSSPVPF
jgi:tRNA pseudouridine32 synthase/23S rRNA pseudouridine746 synthase